MSVSFEQRIEVPLGAAIFDRAAEASEAITWEPPANRFVTGVRSATLTLHLPPVREGRGRRPVVLICPGGGYLGVSLDKEGHVFASWLAGEGIAGAVLKYRLPGSVGPSDPPAPFEDGLHALALLADRADDWCLDLSRLGLIGFSAGGHLAGSLGLRIGELDPAGRLPRPACVALLYPVVSAGPSVGHTASFKQLSHGDLSPESERAFSLEHRVAPSSPPLFLAHAADDGTVPPANSRLLHEAAAAAGVPSELHLLESGGHGFGMGVPGSPAAAWPALFLAWFRRAARQEVGA